ncbi:MAG: ATP-binding cassette, subfamily bacterial [Verrucomicrobiota bacterium]|jgi:ABC-type multidrug transport system fused ATPase/permease subunit
MQGKPPPGQTPQASQKTPPGLAPQTAQGAQAAPSAVAPGALQGLPPPAGFEGKRKGRGGSGAKLSDVHWSLIFKMGWKMIGYCRLLAFSYCLMMLVQSGVNIGMAQLVGQVTKELGSQSASGEAPQRRADANALVAAPPNAPANARVGPPEESFVSKILPTDPKKRVIVVCALWAICALAALSLGIPMRAISTKLDLTISNKMRSQLFGRLLRQSPEFYHTHESGELNAVVNQFTVEASMTLRQVSIDMILQVLILGFTVAVLIYNFKMGDGSEGGGSPLTLGGVVIPPAAIPIAIVLFAFVSPYLTGKLSNKVRDVSRDLQEKMLALNSLVTGAMQSPEEIQAMEAEPMFVKKHDKQLDALLRSRIKNTLTMEYLGLVNGLPSWFIQVVMLGFGVFIAVKSGDPKSAGNVVSIFMLTPQLMAPIGALSAYLVMAGSAWPRIETVNEMLESRARREEKSGTVKVDSVEHTLAAKNVTFSYKAGARKIFDDISFELPPGKITGFVAKMGQGKTTFFKLALRFYDPQQGEVILGGRPVGDYAADNLYGHIAMMSQFPAFFYDTLRANMQMAKEDATDEEIRAICERTGVWKILQAGVQGNPLDEEFAGGRRLSGGQRKLLALTRCLMRDPAILFLDEPTVGMDNMEKFAMLEMIQQALKGHTVMVVDHDLRWLMPFCDYFIVLDEGKIEERGTAEELLAKRGLFFELYHAEEAGGAKAADHSAAPPPAMSGSGLSGRAIPG